MDDPELNLYQPPESHTESEPELSAEPDYHTPPIRRKLAASALDAIILIAIHAAVFGLCEWLFPFAMSEGIQLRVCWLLSVVIFLLFNLPFLRQARSIGKMACGLWIVRTDLDPCSSQRATFARWLPWLLLPLAIYWLGCLVLLIELLLGLRDPPRAPHDILTDTEVVC